MLLRIYFYFTIENERKFANYHHLNNYRLDNLIFVIKNLFLNKNKMTKKKRSRKI